MTKRSRAEVFLELAYDLSDMIEIADREGDIFVRDALKMARAAALLASGTVKPPTTH